MRLPGSGSIIYLIINVEIQAIDKKKYKVVTRGIYYCARMISRQYGTVFTKSNYQDIQKVYSIWICPESHRKQNSITAYRVNEELILGDASEERQDYDKLQVIVITLDKDGLESDDPLIRFLSLLLSHELPVESRKSTLEEEYKIQIDESLTEEMNEMCNIGEAVARRNGIVNFKI